MAIADLQEEILYHHIFCRLPVKSILCFRSVCKSWNRMLREQQFVKLHLQNHHNKKKLLIRAEVCNYYSIDCDGTDVSSYYSYDLDHESVGNRLAEPPVALLMYRTHSQLIGSRNGLIAVSVYRYRLCLNYDFILWNPSTGEVKYLNVTDPVDTYDDTYGYDYDSAMDDWNPLTGESKYLNDTDPVDTYDDTYGYVYDSDIGTYDCKYGFVYDSAIDDYKIVSIRFTYSEKTLVEIFSLRNNSWKKVNYVKYNWERRVLSTKNQDGVEVNGYLYWLVEIVLESSERDIFVLGFSLRDENLGILALPNDMIDKNVDFYSEVSERGLKEMGRSCLASFHFYMEDEFVVWTLKEPEKKESKWEKLINLCLSSPEHKLTCSIRPLWFMKDGKVLVIIGLDKDQEYQHNIRVYDPQTKSLGYDQIHDVKITSGCDMKIIEMAYVESLVSPNMFESGTR